MRRWMALWCVLALCASVAADEPRDVVAVVGEKKTETGANVQNCVIERFKLHSPAMKRAIEVVVVLPPAYHADSIARFPVLLTLHGRRAPYDMWANMQPLRTALAKQPMIVVGFSGDQSSWYIDSPVKADSQFTTFALKELLPFIDQTYRTKADASQRGLAGISMGGFGAMHLVLTAPASFASVSGISGAYEATTDPRREEWFKPLIGAYESNRAAYESLDIPTRFKALGKTTPLPRFQIACGTEDRLIASSQRLDELLKELGATPEYLASPDKHDWAYWRDISPKVIDFHWRVFNNTTAAGPDKQISDQP